MPEVKNISIGSLPQAVSAVRSKTSLCASTPASKSSQPSRAPFAIIRCSTVSQFFAARIASSATWPSGVQTSALTPAALKR